MKVTLIYAGIVGKGFDSIGKGMDSGWISHGLCHLSACAKQAGFEVDLVDLRALRDWDHFRSEIAARKPRICGLTMMSVDYNPVMRCIDLVKEVDSSIVTVVGGPHPTLAPDEVASNPNVDYIITHEGEVTFVRLLEDLQSSLAVSPSTEGPSALNPQPSTRILRGEAPNLDDLPHSDRDLFFEEWRKFGYRLSSPEVPLADLPVPFVTIIAGRGCIYNCSFCQPAEKRIFGARVRRRSVANVMGELERLRDKYQFNSLMIHDDCLTEDREWVKEFCQAYRERGFRQPFWCQSRADLIVRYEDMVELMVGAGLKGFFVGFESGSDRVLKFLRKGTTAAQNLKAAAVCRQHRIKIWANYMLGLPTETKEEIKETIAMLKAIDPDYYSPAFYTPHPGTDLFDYCQEQDLSLITDHDSFRRNPTEAKIKGHDLDFLVWAAEESQRRTPANTLKRWARQSLRRYASPARIVRKLRKTLRPVG